MSRSDSDSIRSAMVGVLRGDARTLSPEFKRWEELVDLCQKHGLAARLFRLLKRAGLTGELSAGKSRELEHSYYFSVQNHLAFQKKSFDLLSGLESAGIPSIVLKGWPLARRVYEFPEERVFMDLDLLMPKESRPAVKEFFLAKGFKSIHEEGRFFANENKLEFQSSQEPWLVVECHFALGYGRHEIEPKWTEKTERKFDTPAGLLTVRLLPPEEEFLYLLFHAGTQHRFQNLYWLLDLSLFLKSQDPGFADSLRLKFKNHALGPTWELARFFLSRFTEIEAAEDRVFAGWFDAVIFRRADESVLTKTRLRAFLHGGWGPFSRYAWARWSARRELR